MKGRTMALAAVLIAAGPATASGTGAPARPDLKVTKIAGVPDTVTPGDRFDVRVTVRNRGAVRAGESRLTAFLSRDERWDDEDVRLGGDPKVKSLRRHRAITTSRRFKVNEQSARGIYRVIVCSDGTAAVTEARESNNCRASSDRVIIRGPIISPPPR